MGIYGNIFYKWWIVNMNKEAGKWVKRKSIGAIMSGISLQDAGIPGAPVATHAMQKVLQNAFGATVNSAIFNFIPKGCRTSLNGKSRNVYVSVR